MLVKEPPSESSSSSLDSSFIDKDKSLEDESVLEKQTDSSSTLCLNTEECKNEGSKCDITDGDEFWN